MYKVVACGSTTKENKIQPSCGWVLDCNGIGVGLAPRCPHCRNNLVFVQASDAQALLEWCDERNLAAPRWLLNSVPVG